MQFLGLIACQQKNWFHRLRKVTCSMQGECGESLTDGSQVVKKVNLHPIDHLHPIHLSSVQYQFFA